LTLENAADGPLPDLDMPSLFRFLVAVGLVGAVAFFTVFALANLVKFQPREIVVTVPSDKFVKQQ